jgi:hypothetical protein
MAAHSVWAQLSKKTSATTSMDAEPPKEKWMKLSIPTRPTLNLLEKPVCGYFMW